LKKELAGFAVALAAVVLVAYTFAPYLDLLNPMGGIWSGVLYAELPSGTEISLEGLGASVSVCRDSYGVPHIYAENEEDLFYVFGYVQAQDRLFEMDFQRRLAEGKLAEVVGESLYETDLFFRTIGLGKAANSSFQALVGQNDQNMVKVLAEFAEGVNRAIENMKATGELPIEFKILGYEPEPWTSFDTLAVGKLIGWELTGDFYDLEFMKAYEAFGNLTDELFSFKDPYEICTYRGNFTPVDPPAQVDMETIQLPNTEREKVVHAITDILEWKENAERLVQPVKDAFASNDWVVNGSLTTTGKPILCNDPHLQLMAPPVWYEAHLVVSNSSGVFMNVRGVTFPGIPVIVIGHNQNLSWGFTNVGADVLDFYRYVWSGDGDRYWYLNQWEDVIRSQEVIKVKGDAGVEERNVLINMTRHGPIIEQDNEKFAMKWVGSFPTLEARAMYKFNVARNMNEFKDGLRDFSVPAQNMVYADTEGNIGWWANGRYPVRMNVSDANDYLEYRLPFNGSQARGEWGDWSDLDAWVDPPEEVPHLINPVLGYVATANNCPISREDYQYWLGWTWAENYRVQRIQNLLNESQPLGLQEMKGIQTDIYDVPAEKLVPYIIDACGNRQMTTDLENATRLLQDWNFRMDKDLVAPTIFATWLEKLKNNTFTDEYYKAGFEGRLPTTETIQYLVERNSTRWFDNVETGNMETRDDMIFQSLNDTVQQLKDELGDNMLEWKWSAVHHLDLEHPLGKALSWLNYPKLPIGGWENNINPAPGLNVQNGPSWRQIVDFNNLNNSLCIIPGGQRGHPFSKHYDDQLELWLNGEYKPMTFPASPEEQGDKEGVITFSPKG